MIGAADSWVRTLQGQNPISTGIELTPVDRLLSLHQKTIDRLIDCIAPETHELHDALLRTLFQFASWVHQLPASETHHHSYLGGLLTHSLEVALWSAEAARGRLGDLSLSGWERRRQERTFVLAVALSGLLHDLGKPVADLIVINPEGQVAWNPYRGSLMAWAQSHHLTHYHLQWLRGRGARHRGFNLLILRNVVEPELFDRIREVGPDLEAALVRALNQEATEEDPASVLVTRADQESTVRSLRDPRRQTIFGGPAPERILVHAMRQLLYLAVWTPNLPGSPLWYLDHQLYLSWPRAAGDIQRILEQDPYCAIPLDAELLMHFMQDRGLLAPMDPEAEIPTSLKTLQPEGLDVPLQMVQLRSPRLLFDGILPESQKIMNPMQHPWQGKVPESSSVTPAQHEATQDPISPGALPTVHQALDAMEEQPKSSLKCELQNASDRYEWQLRDQHLFIPHPETALALGIEPMALIEALDGEDWLEPGGAGNIRKVRVIEGRRGLLLSRTVSSELLKAMKVPRRKSRRKNEIRA